MFTCPDVDIHSVYIDGELPESFVRQYEEHVASCPECKKIQESLLRMKKLLKAEKPDIVLTYNIKPNVYGGMACKSLKLRYIPNITGLGFLFKNKRSFCKKTEPLCFIYKIRCCGSSCCSCSFCFSSFKS